MKKIYILVAILSLMFLAGCNTEITSFSIGESVGDIDQTNNIITVILPYGTDVTKLAPTIKHTGKSISPASGSVHYFGIPVRYTVTGYDGSTRKYIARVVICEYHSDLIGILNYVPAGSFLRDGNNSNLNISTITRPFYMSRYEITRAQYLAIMGTDPSDYRYSTGMHDPVQHVSWYHAIAFCNKLSIAEGLNPVYSVSGIDFATLAYEAIPILMNTVWDAATANWDANGYRLPTEMEWEWAAMGATSGSGYTSPTYLTGYAKPFAGSNATNAAGDNGTNAYEDYVWGGINVANMTSLPVGSRLPNELGLHDMSGNIAEWCWDWAAPYLTGSLTDYRGPDLPYYPWGPERIVRGGDWQGRGYYSGIDFRDCYRPNVRDHFIGFRVVRKGRY